MSRWGKVRDNFRMDEIIEADEEEEVEEESASGRKNASVVQMKMQSNPMLNKNAAAVGAQRRRMPSRK